VIFVCNAGLTTATTNSDLVRVFSKFGPIDRVVMVPKKSYSFLIFAREDSAEVAMATVNGKVGLSDAGPLYLAFVASAPPVEDPWQDVALPEGLRLLPEFVTEEEEEELLATFRWDKTGGGKMKHRQVQHFGFEFSYDTNDIDPSQPLKDQPIPPTCKRVAMRAQSEGLLKDEPDQLTVNRYLPGQGIPSHTDSHSCCTETLLSLSLQSGVVMDFRGPNGEQVPLWLPPRSLLVLTGPARYCWKHGITPRHCDTVPGEILQHGDGLTLAQRDTRVSLTFRKTIPGHWVCPYPDLCSRNKASPSPKASSDFLTKLAEKATQLETKLVHQVYEEIAGHFSETRHKPWPRVTQFISTIPNGGIILDLGCGNGKYLGQEEDDGRSRFEVGADYSQNLLAIVRERGHQALRCDLMAVPFRDNIVSGLLCIAALHHLASEERRVASLQEMSRVLCVGGRALIYVWAKDQKKKEMSSYLKQNKKNRDGGAEGKEHVDRETGEFGLPVHINRTQFQHQDNLVPWKLKGGEEEEEKVFLRYYHVFEEGELESLVEKVEKLIVVESYYDQGNWCSVVEKV